MNGHSVTMSSEIKQVYFSRKEVAARLGMSPDTLYSWIRRYYPQLRRRPMKICEGDVKALIRAKEREQYITEISRVVNAMKAKHDAAIKRLQRELDRVDNLKSKADDLRKMLFPV